MEGHIMRSLLLILVFALVSSQARTLPEDFDKLKGSFGKRGTPPPSPPQAPSGPIQKAFLLLLPKFNNYGRRNPPGPPSPKPGPPYTPVIEMIITPRAVENIFGALKNYGRDPPPLPPAPKLPTPTRPASGGGVAAMVAKKSSENLFRSAGR
ncbi:hypothetical protein CDL12_18988 [Handroanthus impetiginosus]|uniref:Uncharacterized protein n=1 Tax=Handroanthus impetiginosus TaxID=429701 RepID=A0A2G9GT95_9LAMI|nr:hypothetical protein CDL12_18988 [Handroanthus impetiginosus]